MLLRKQVKNRELLHLEIEDVTTPVLFLEIQKLRIEVKIELVDSYFRGEVKYLL